MTNIFKPSGKFLGLGMGLGVALLLSSCGESPEELAAKAKAAQEAQAAQQEKDMLTASNSALSVVLAQLFDQYPLIEAGAEAPSFGSAQMKDLHSYSIPVRIPIVVKESIYHKQEVPIQLDDMRKAINESANTAMQPDALYLVQIGAPLATIEEDDKQVKPLPEELARKIVALQDLAKGPVFLQVRQAGEAMELQAQVDIVQREGADIHVQGITLNDHQLDFFKDSLSDAQIPDGERSRIINGDWIKERKEAIMAGITLFNADAAPYIESREAQARKLLLERSTALQLAEKATKEKEAAAAAVAEERLKLMHQLMAAGKDYQGEWKRKKDFGRLGLKILKSEDVLDSIHFVGSLYDVDLPEAALDVSGRCELGEASGDAPVIIRVYDGQYVTTHATAEVYDSRDGVLNLSLSTDGKLQGSLSCTSWEGQPEKDFAVQMSTDVPAPEAEAEKEEKTDEPDESGDLSE